MPGEKVLVTGSSGFIGSHVADVLEERDYQVILFDAVPAKYKTNTQEEYIGDLLNPDHIAKAMKNCQYVFHFAAQADINSSSEDPTKTIHNNIIGTQNILEMARKTSVKRVLFASTIYVYSELGSFYRVSKQACEKIIEEYQKEFGLDYTILRFGSLYGPRANDFNAIRSFLIHAIKEKKIIRRGDGEELREYIHVKDAARLSVVSLDEKHKNKHLIITGNQQIKVKDLLTMIREIFNGKIEIEFDLEDELHHYEITPYNYKPQVAQKITSDTFHDLGQGLLDLLYDLELEMNKENGEKRIGLRKRKK
ncbi:MAG: NAD(P)-dependent oxidoreductase [Candidatus Marinimicrobia bacterium]|nr:NAD(P)-dependent oxidoreductase [Candidatus Neomarinimicrobiota bacterium]